MYSWVGDKNTIGMGINVGPWVGVGVLLICILGWVIGGRYSIL